MYYVLIIIEGDLLFIIVVGGVVIGLGMGFVFRNGGVLDGIDMLVVLLFRKLFFGISDLILFFNIFVFIFVFIVFGFKGVILLVFVYFIVLKVIYIIEEGLSGLKMFKIIIKDYDIMNKEIKERLGRYCIFIKVIIDEENNLFVEIFCVINKFEE